MSVARAYVWYDTRRRECSECDDSDETSATGRDEMLRVVVDLTTLEGSRVRPEVRAEAQWRSCILELSNA
ncbi:hypothetical protein E4U56_007442 [Claviceps arundinis]|uniref:Uncharacterized protein n=1 Tax=Claviceps arundinis TaxID=1623583 RepID=A0A9P7MUZ5_9HYPO|nr:hypothetical protein E4U56_007442 [Claviceps arundinis]